MSKAFLRESEFELPDVVVVRPAPEAGAGGQISVTAEGASRLREELKRLVDEERPRYSGREDLDVEDRMELQSIDQRIRQLSEGLRVASIVEVPADDRDVVRIGANVTVCDRKKVQSRYRIVGVLETDLDPDWISWESPLGRALLGRREGERVTFMAPRGEIALEIISVDYA